METRSNTAVLGISPYFDGLNNRDHLDVNEMWENFGAFSILCFNVFMNFVREAFFFLFIFTHFHMFEDSRSVTIAILKAYTGIPTFQNFH